MSMGRIERRFAALKAQGRAGLVTFVMAGDPDRDTAQQILDGLPAAGADLIELGIAFSDPMADGPSIQAAGLRALKAGQSLRRTLEMVSRFRQHDDDTPIILMGYFNPIDSFGVADFLAAARDAGVDGLIVVDLPPEEDDELCRPAIEQGLRFIRLVAPTTGAQRLPRVLAGAGGFVYYVAVAGVTGVKSAEADMVAAGVARLRAATDLPIAAGFGVKTPQRAAQIAQVADGVVVGTAIIDRLATMLDDAGRARRGAVEEVLAFVSALADGICQQDRDIS